VKEAGEEEGGRAVTAPAARDAAPTSAREAWRSMGRGVGICGEERRGQDRRGQDRKREEKGERASR